MLLKLLAASAAVALAACGNSAEKPAEQPSALAQDNSQPAISSAAVPSAKASFANAEVKPSLAAQNDNAKSAIGEVSAVIGKKDISVGGKASCEITFNYAGRARQSVTWEGEGCREVNASFLNRDRLEELGQWDDLVMNVKENVVNLPQGKVLYVEGSFSAAIYPLNYEGELFEYSVAD